MIICSRMPRGRNSAIGMVWMQSVARWATDNGQLKVFNSTAAYGFWAGSAHRRSHRPSPGADRTSVGFRCTHCGASPPFRPQNCGAVDQTLPATGMIPNYCDFTKDSAFKAPGQRPSRGALVTANCRGCEDRATPTLSRRPTRREAVQRTPTNGCGTAPPSRRSAPNIWDSTKRPVNSRTSMRLACRD